MSERLKGGRGRGIPRVWGEGAELNLVNTGVVGQRGKDRECGYGFGRVEWAGGSLPTPV